MLTITRLVRLAPLDVVRGVLQRYLELDVVLRGAAHVDEDLEVVVGRVGRVRVVAHLGYRWLQALRTGATQMASTETHGRTAASHWALRSSAAQI